MWALAVWVEASKVFQDIIPRKWIKGRCVYWPPNGVNVNRAMDEGRDVEENWERFDLVKIKCESHEKETCLAYDFTTSAESDIEKSLDKGAAQINSGTSPPKKDLPKPPSQKSASQVQRLNSRLPSSASPSPVRKADSPSPVRKAASPSPVRKSVSPSPVRKSVSPSSPSRSGYGSSFNSKSLPRRSPRKHERSRSTTVRKSKNILSRISSSPSSPSRSGYGSSFDSRSLQRRSPRKHERSRSTINDSSRISPCSRSPRRDQPRGNLQQSNKSARNIQARYTEIVEIFPMDMGKYQKKSMKVLLEIRQLLLNIGRNYEPEDSPFHLVQIDSLDQLDEFEVTLRDIDVRNRLVKQLVKVGGADYKDQTRQILKRLFTNKMMGSMNMKGNGGKLAFDAKRLLEVIIECVMKKYGASEIDVKQVVARCLKNAPDRKDGGGRKSK